MPVGQVSWPPSMGERAVLGEAVKVKPFGWPAANLDSLTENKMRLTKGEVPVTG